MRRAFKSAIATAALLSLVTWFGCGTTPTAVPQTPVEEEQEEESTGCQSDDECVF